MTLEDVEKLFLNLEQDRDQTVFNWVQRRNLRGKNPEHIFGVRRLLGAMGQCLLKHHIFICLKEMSLCTS